MDMDVKGKIKSHVVRILPDNILFWNRIYSYALRSCPQFPSYIRE